MELELKPWEKNLLKDIKQVDKQKRRYWVVYYIEDSVDGAGKSMFTKYLCQNKKYKAFKLPMDKPDRIRMAVCQIVKKENIEMFIFDFTRTLGEETSLKDMFQVIEELKNGHLVSVMYGKPMQVFFKSPHVLIFTNEKFSDHLSKLSLDRWRPFLIDPQGGLNHAVWTEERHQHEYVPYEAMEGYLAKEINNNPGKEKPRDIESEE